MFCSSQHEQTSLLIPFILAIFVLSLFPVVFHLPLPSVAVHNWLRSSVVSVPPKTIISSSPPVLPSLHAVSTSSIRVLE